MNCRRSEALLSDLQNGPLPPRAANALQAHVERCPDCRRRQEEFRAIGRELCALPRPQAASALAHRAIVQWQAETSTTLALSGTRRYAGRMALAALLLGALGIGIARWETGRSALAVGGHPGIAPGAESAQHWDAQARPAAAPPSHAFAADPTSVAPHPSNTPTPQKALSRVPGVERLHAAPPGFRPRTADIVPPESPVADRRPMADMVYLNSDPVVTMARWAQVQPNVLTALVAQMEASVRGGDDFVTVPMPLLAGNGPGAIRAALVGYRQEKEIVDTRLVHKVTIGSKALSFADLCMQLREETGIEITANRSVADDKITLFCKDRPLRDIMRQINRLFGFNWIRTGEPDAFHYELTQPLSAQLTEEELRNKDRNEALIALDHEMQKYKKFLALTASEAKTQAESVANEDKETLETLGEGGWGPVHLYFDLSPNDMAALTSRQGLDYSTAPESDQQMLLPQDVASGILQGLSQMHYQTEAGGGLKFGSPEQLPDGMPVSTLPGATPVARLNLNFNTPGQVTLTGASGVNVVQTAPDPNGGTSKTTSQVMNGSPLAVGVSPSVQNPGNAAANAKWARDPALRPHITLEPKGQAANGKVTTADVLEALYKATGKDIISDYYTHLFPSGAVSVQDVSIFDALNRVCDTLRVRWGRENDWLQFRDTGFFNDRPKEVSNRQLKRWAASQREYHALTLDDLTEIGQLTDTQLNADTMAEGAHQLYGLAQWEMTRNLRRDLRFFGKLTPELRRAAQSKTGMGFEQLPMGLRKKFAEMVFGQDSEQVNAGSKDLTSATLQVDYPLKAGKESAPEEGGLPEPVFTYIVNGGATVGKWKRVVSPHAESLTFPGGVRANRQSEK